MAIPRELTKISDTVWELPRSYKPDMLVPARIYATKKLVEAMDEGVFDQVTNVACLPGILNYAFCMPDGHWGYGFPIGGVAAMDPRTGVISPGGIGFDINCGMRLVLTNLTYDEVKPRLKELVDALFYRVPSGVGSKGFVKLSQEEFREVMTRGAQWCLNKGCAWPEDLERTEERGCFQGADPDKVSMRAVERGFRSDRNLGLRQPLLRDTGGKTGEYLRSGNGEEAGYNDPEPGGRHVPLRQPRVRPPDCHGLPEDFSQRHGTEIQDQGARPGACLRAFSIS